MTKKIHPAAIHALIEALSLAFWYKRDLRLFLDTTLPDNNLIAQLDWDDYKRNIVGRLVRTMDVGSKHQANLLTLILATADIDNPEHLKRLDDGAKKYKDALTAIDNLKSKVRQLRTQREEREEIARRQQTEQARASFRAAMGKKLLELKHEFQVMLSNPDSQARGYALEKLLPKLFSVFDIDSRASFKLEGEQIDGAFTFQGTEYLVEVRWRKRKSTADELGAFSTKVKRKLENTLGLFLSIEGFEKNAIKLHSQSGTVLIAMDGSDLSLVLEDRIDLSELLIRKKQHASRTGEIMLGANELL